MTIDTKTLVGTPDEGPLGFCGLDAPGHIDIVEGCIEHRETTECVEWEESIRSPLPLSTRDVLEDARAWRHFEEAVAASNAGDDEPLERLYATDPIFHAAVELRAVPLRAAMDRLSSDSQKVAVSWTQRVEELEHDLAVARRRLVILEGLADNGIKSAAVAEQDNDPHNFPLIASQDDPKMVAVAITRKALWGRVRMVVMDPMSAVEESFGPYAKDMNDG